MVPVMGEAVALVAVKAGVLVTPEAASPIAVFELVQVKVAPAGVLAKVFAGTAAPAQKVKFGSAVTVGKGVTVTVDTAVPVHPAVVPVTVYVVVVTGEAVAVLTPVDVAPALHVYVVAPPAVNVAATPAQIVGEFTVTTGAGDTVTVDTAVDVQPAADVPVTV